MPRKRAYPRDMELNLTPGQRARVRQAIASGGSMRSSKPYREPSLCGTAVGLPALERIASSSEAEAVHE